MKPQTETEINPLLFEFSKEQFIFMELSLILTLFACPVLLWTTENGLISLIVYMGLFQIAIPLCYMVFLFKGKRAFEYYFTGELTMRKNLLKWGALFSLFSFGVNFLISWIYFAYFLDYESTTFPVDFANGYTISLFIVVFITFYPFLEEIYWRVFIAKTFPRTEFYYILNSLHYGLVHLFVLLQFTGFGVAFTAGVYFFAIGCVLIYIKRFIRLPSVILIHIAMNLGFVLGLYIFYLN